MKTFGSLLLGVLLTVQTGTAGNLEEFFDQADQFFNDYVKKNRVNYSALKESPQSLNRLVSQMQTINLQNASTKEKQAFWINAYNLTVIHTLVEHYPKTANNIDGFFKAKKHEIASSHLTLNQLVKKKLRKPYHNPRLLFALCKGAKGSPPIENYAYKPGQLTVQLNKHLRNTINKGGYIKINKSSNSVRIPLTFYNYRKELKEVEQSYKSFINHFLRYDNIPADYEVKFYPFNWALNERK